MTVYHEMYRCFVPSGSTRELIPKGVIRILECICAPITSSYNVITQSMTLHKVKIKVQSSWESVLENICLLISTVLSYSKDGYIMISFCRVLISLCRVLIVLADSVDKFTVFGGCFGLLLLMIFWPPNIISAVKMRLNASQGIVLVVRNNHVVVGGGVNARRRHSWVSNQLVVLGVSQGFGLHFLQSIPLA